MRIRDVATRFPYLTDWERSVGEVGVSWLYRHQLPASPAAVALVDERLRERRAARRRGWYVSSLSIAAGIAGVMAFTIEAWPDGVLSGVVWLVMLPAFAIGAVVDVVVRRRVWARWDRKLAAALPVRLAPLSRPGYADLVGREALLLGALLLAGGLGYAVSLGAAGKPEGAAAAAGLTLLFAGHAVASLESARRRPVVAGDVQALAIDDRLRGEEASQAVSTGVFWMALMPAVDVGNSWGFPFLLGVIVVVASVRHRYGYLVVEGRIVPRVPA